MTKIVSKILKSNLLFSLAQITTLFLIAIFTTSLVSNLVNSLIYLDNFWNILLPIFILYFFLILVLVFIYPIKIKLEIQNLIKSWKLALTWICLLFLGFLAFYILHSALILSGFNDIISYNFVLSTEEVTFSILQIFSIILVVLIQTLFEEWFFRGWLLDFFKKLIIYKNVKINTNIAIIGSAILFGLIHIFGSNFAIANFLFTFLLALVWGFIAIETKSFMGVWVLHFINNLFFVFAFGYNQFLFAKTAFFQMENLPNNFIWQTIFIGINLILVWVYKKLYTKPSNQSHSLIYNN